MTRYHQFLTALMLLAVILCSTMQTAVSASPWQSPLFLDHPLLGEIWDSNKEAWLSVEQLVFELRQYDYLLLGENHDNPDHHRLQAKLISDLADAGKKPNVVMEMLTLNSWRDQPKNWTNLQQLQQMASQRNTGWTWEIYTPILETIVKHRLNLFAGNIERNELHASVNKTTSEYAIQELSKEYQINMATLETLQHNIIESHCGHASTNLIMFMTHAQLLRDQVMISSMLKQEKPVVLVAGAEHVRNDYAIPAQLLNKYKILSFISVAFIEVQADLLNPQDYLQKNKAGNLNKVFDILYFTASNTKEDPCVKFRKQLKDMQHRQTPQNAE